MKQVLYILFGWGLTAIVSWCMGKLLLRRLPLPLSRQEENVFAFLAGSATLSLAVFLLAELHLAYKASFLALSAVVIAAAQRLQVWRPRGERLPPTPRLWKLVFLGMWLAFGSVYFLNALAPEVSPDGTAYHLALVARFARERGFSAIAPNFYASLPQGLEMLFLFAFVWGRHSAAALVHCTYLLLLPWLILNYGRRIGLPIAGVTGGLLVYIAPVAGITGTSAYNDVAIATVGFAVFALLEIWHEQRENALLLPAGLLAGFAFDIKYTGFVAAPYAMAFVAYHLWRRGKPVLRPVLLLSLCAAPLILPTLGRNAIVARNPVSPFLNRIFLNPYVSVSSEEQWRNYMRSYGLHSPWQLAYETTTGGHGMAGVLGPVFLLAPLSLLALRSAPGRRLLLAALVFLLPYPMNLGTRFFLPAATFLAPAMAIGLGGGIGLFRVATPAAISWWPQPVNWRIGTIPVRIALGSGTVLLVLLVAHAFLSWPSSIDKYAQPYTWHITEVPWRAALRLEPEDTYLRRYLGDDYAMMRFIERETPPDSRIYCSGSPPGAYCTRELLPSYWSVFNWRLWGVLLSGFDSGSQPLRILTFRGAPQTLREIRLLQVRSAQSVTPSINEMRIFGPSGELQPDRAWRIDAHPFPWGAHLAFDRNPVTRWEAWQEMRQGAWLEVDFGMDQAVISVRVEAKYDQAAVRWQLQGKAATGEWSVLPTTLEEITVPPLDLRRAATEEFKRYNVRYILVDEPSFCQEFRDHQRLWGIRKLAEFGNKQLYYIE